MKYAEEHIKVDGDGNNTINRAVVQSLISRFCLFEGTWRKYHALQNATTYLEECTRASKEVMNKYTTLHPNYEELFNSESLDGINGIILYKEYATSQLCHGLTRMVRTGESQIEATKDAVDSYCAVTDILSKTVPHTEVIKMYMHSSATGIIVYITQYVLPIW